MNWNKISSDCPIAFVELMNAYDWLIMPDLELGYFSIENGAQTWHKFNERNLYDFFDERAVYISVVYEAAIETPFWVSVDYVEDALGIGIEIDDYKTRTGAESAAFEKAFEILERQLNKEA